ncbi:flagellar assembly factor FliW [Peptoclostridium litorale DSM 5388]|uniref:Flagellar assembly factor FliW n=1 Tax=Peptoclostridium litorale DSM 5388 TaxID=1121324 RepID=A0A069RDB6_PEPLI|nr:flagellar assembly protein FliW [Peptoclostridium litorale]KDR94758.1 flagellar assembly factor FliW [Peptoclostridium litorale DSM 5388]SIN92040.1 flagellar assembly factor FliW [Peptoclostridium litorale DSM 5388]
MNIKTSNFGDIDIDEKGIIAFDSGLPGFEQLKRFVLIKESDMVIDWLQSIDSEIAFPLINPFLIKDDYEFEIPQADIARLQIDDMEDIAVYSVVTIPENIKDIRANLQAPVVINTKEKKGKQIILGEEYPIRYEFYQKVGE